MTKHQYHAVITAISAWGLLLFSSVVDKPWVSAIGYCLAFIQVLIHLYWHYRVTKEQTP